MNEQAIDREAIERITLLNQLREEMNRAERYGHFVSLILFDLKENLARVTEQRWRQLASVIQCVRRNLRRVDRVSTSPPYGIAVVLPHTSTDGAETVTRRLCDEIAYTFGYRARYTINCYPEDGSRPIELLESSAIYKSP